jgi:hypothetical protein
MANPLIGPQRRASAVDPFHLGVCRAVLAYAEARRYRGYNKHDALNSPLLHAMALRNRWLRLLCIQLVTRAPVNLRPLLGVRPTINPKGLSLFARTYLSLHELEAAADDTPWLAKAEQCLDWLVERSRRVHGYSGDCWGYPYDWQDVGFFAPAQMPNCVVTCFVARAFLHAYQVTGRSRYLDVARSACDFLLRDLTVLHDDPRMLAISYAPVDMRWVVMDTSALAGAVLAQVAAVTDELALHAPARRLIAYVLDKQTDYGAWYYSHPPSDSHITHDNYHTGFILDAILEYRDASGEDDVMGPYHRGLSFYAERLFLLNGAPKWMHDRVFPHDVHGSAQGIITFANAARFRSGYGRFARKIADWAIANLYDPGGGRFYYQVSRWHTKRFTLMRWCNAWMAFALAALMRLDTKPAEVLEGSRVQGSKGFRTADPYATRTLEPSNP